MVQPFDQTNWQIALEPLLAGLQTMLIANRATVATAESCTGGLIATALTHLPGSSQVYMGGVAAYDNGVKSNVLGVPASLIESEGAVSKAVAEAMAEGVRRLLKVDFAVSITGIAGPTGGSPKKPVGTVFCGIARANGCRVKEFRLQGTRSEIRHEAARLALIELQGEVSR